MHPAVVSEPAAPSITTALLYQPLDFVVVRAPLLSVEAYLDLGDEERQVALLSDPHVRRAIAVGSPSLAGAMERFKQSGLTRRDADRMRAKLLRYQIRMSTRPTPFGLFAGVALSDWGAVTDLTVRSSCMQTRTRPDMAQLMAMVMAAEANPAIRRRLSLFTNPLAVIEAGRVELAERAPTGTGGQRPPVSVRATGVVKQALALARQPVPYENLVAKLCETSSSATPEKVEKLLAELWEQTFLLTDLRPPLTTDSPARYVAERLAGIPEAAEILTKLDTFLTAAAAWDRLEPEESVTAFSALLAQAGAPPDGSQDIPVQVDMAMSVAGRLGQAVATEAARAAELLLRLSPAPRGLSYLASYRQAFTARYGHDREVPLLELLNPHRGLGPPSMHGHAHVGPDPAKAAQRAQTLLRLACGALHNRERAILLDDDALTRLETWRPDPKTAPLSMDINILVAARSSAAIDSGDFTVVVGPNLGGLAAGRNLGRFAGMLAPDGLSALQQAAAAEEAHAPQQLWAELVFLPPNMRSANVVIRPQVRTYEIPLGASAGVPASSIIPLDELVVGVDQDRFYVRWPAAGKRVAFSSGHMLNLSNAPPAGRFLVELSNDGKALFTTFDWGPVEDFPYLPRVQTGRVVLRPAQWRIQKDDLAMEPADAYRRSLDRWRSEWDVPRHVCLSFGDNRLVLDLDQDAQAAELKAELQKLADGGAIIVQELLPALDEAWLPGPGGRYYSEFVVSLVLGLERPSTAPSRVAGSETARAPSPQVRPAPVAAAAEQAAAGPASRLHPPGSDWLFVKLYSPRNHEEDLIAESMRTFAENVIGSGLADSWFFIRYSDPDAHLRVRFHGSPERLTGHLFGHVCDWAGRLMSDGLCLRFVFDTYEQEVERFGGVAGMAAAEAIFSADSRGAAELLRCSRAKQWQHDRTTLVALSIDDFLGGLGFHETERLGWYRTHTTAGGPDVGSEYRQRKTVLRSLLGQPQWLAGQPGGAEIAGALAARRDALSAAAHRLRELAGQGVLGQSLDTLCASFVHLHVNRLAGLDAAPEQRILSLLLRTREGLEKSPAARATQ